MKIFRLSADSHGRAQNKKKQKKNHKVKIKTVEIIF